MLDIGQFGTQHWYQDYIVDYYLHEHIQYKIAMNTFDLLATTSIDLSDKTHLLKLCN